MLAREIGKSIQKAVRCVHARDSLLYNFLVVVYIDFFPGLCDNVRVLKIMERGDEETFDCDDHPRGSGALAASRGRKRQKWRFPERGLSGRICCRHREGLDAAGFGAGGRFRLFYRRPDERAGGGDGRGRGLRAGAAGCAVRRCASRVACDVAEGGTAGRRPRMARALPRRRARTARPAAPEARGENAPDFLHAPLPDRRTGEHFVQPAPVRLASLALPRGEASAVPHMGTRRGAVPPHA